MSTITILGSVSEPDTFFCESLAKRIKEQDNSISINFTALFETDYLSKIDILKQKFGAKSTSIFHHEGFHIVLLDVHTGNPKYIGDIAKLIDYANSKGVPNASTCNTVLFNRGVREETYKIAMPMDKIHPIVYLQFEDVGGGRNAIELGKVFIELYADACPKACENFVDLCTVDRGSQYKGYEGTSIHRIVKNGWIQCGDVVDGTGKNSVAALPGVPDECFSIDFGHKLGGIVGYCNDGPHTNGSQFFITLGPSAWMNKKFVAIGRVLQVLS